MTKQEQEIFNIGNCGYCGKKLHFVKDPDGLKFSDGHPNMVPQPYITYGNRFFCSEQCKIQYKKAHGCFITTAVCKNDGKPDNCNELETLRHFRDTYMKEKHPEDVELYYQIAPVICNRIDSFSDHSTIYNKIKEKWILPCLSFISKNEDEKAYDHYKEMVKVLKNKYIDNYVLEKLIYCLNESAIVLKNSKTESNDTIKELLKIADSLRSNNEPDLKNLDFYTDPYKNLLSLIS